MSAIGSGLPSFEYRFQLDLVGEETKNRFMGDFKYVRPNLRNQSNIEKLKTQLDGDLANIDKNISFIHRALAHLRYTITEAPKWWEDNEMGFGLYDTNVILDIYTKVITFEKQFSETVLAAGSPAKTEESKEEKATEPK